MKYKCALVVAGVMALVGACSPAPGNAGMAPDSTSMANDMAEIGKVRDGWQAAWKSGNPAALAAYYAPDAHVMDNNQPTAMGPQGVTAAMTGMMSQMTPTNVTLTSEKVEVAGDLAYDRGTYHMTMTPKTAGAAAVPDSGRYLVILKRQSDKSWKLVEEIGNSPVPLPMPSMAPKKGK